MGCDIVFKLHPQSNSSSSDGELTLEELVIKNSSLSSGFSIEEVASELLKNKDIQAQLAKYIKDGQFKDVLEINEHYLNTKGLVGNTSIAGLKSRFYSIPWYSSKTPFSPDILLVDYLKLNGKDFTGRVLKDGREIFVLSSKPASLHQFNNFIKVRDSILLDSEPDPKLEEYLEELKHLEEFKNLENIQDLLLDYQVNPNKYEDVLIEKGFTPYIKNKLRKYLNLSTKETYEDSFTNEIVSRLEYIPRTYNRKISKKLFIKLLGVFHPELLEKYKLNKNEVIKDNLKIEELFNVAFKDNVNSDFNYKVIDITGTDIILETKFKNMETSYGFSYQTVTDMVNFLEDYRGYGIYTYEINGDTYYYCSLDSITSKSKAKQFLSLASAKKYIDEQYNLNNSIGKTANLGFKMAQLTNSPNAFEDSVFHAPDTVLKSIDVDLKIRSRQEFESLVDKDDREFFDGKHLLKEVQDYYLSVLDDSNKSQFSNIIDTTEKAAIFLCRINTDLGAREQRDYSSDKAKETIKNILTEIYTASQKPKYFYISSVIDVSYTDKQTGKKVKNFKYLGVPVESRIKYKAAYSRPAPSIDNMIEIAELLKDKFGIKTEILHPNEIAEKFGDKVDASAKAWISNGIIYINGVTANTNDLMHEYTHLLLGIVKSTNMDMYMKLMDKIGESNEAKVTKTKRDLRNIYENISDIDLNEEVFASLFGDYLAGRDLHTLFGDMQNVKKVLDENLQKILPKASEEDFIKLYKGKINDVFTSFTKGINKLTNGLEFGDYGSYRKASNIIGEWLKDGSLTEKGC